MPILFLAGDVMTGRGIDQILPNPAPPGLHEGYLSSALQYVQIAEEANGPIPRPAPFNYVWGDALAELERMAPDYRIVNLETAVTLSEAWQPKGINYRMSPANVPCLTAAGFDCCTLANNHILDWGEAGLIETLGTLTRAGIAFAGAGSDRASAATPAVLDAPGKGRVLVFAFGHGSSGVPLGWTALAKAPGVNILPDLSDDTAGRVADHVKGIREKTDLVVMSIHWGGNWGYEVAAQQRAFAQALIDGGGADVVFGHSSHHPKGIEVHRGRLILYGCGDLLNDYEGIGGYEEYRDDLAVMYFPGLDSRSGELRALTMIPMRIAKFRLNRPTADDADWLRARLDRECRVLGTGVEADGDGRLTLRWQ